MISVSSGKSYVERILSFEEIEIGRINVKKRQITGEIKLKFPNGRVDSFSLIFSYSEDVQVDKNMAGLILTMPVINFTYFAKRLILNYPTTVADRRIISDFVRINAREVFINKICRRRYEFFKPEFLPSEEEINISNSEGITQVVARERMVDTDQMITSNSSAMVLSSGGKESLLTYGLLNELGLKVYPCFFNESGGHWKTAKTSHDYFYRNFQDVSKIWSNVDRFYKYMLENMSILDRSAIRRRADTYPIQLFIFPVYIFATLPLIRKSGIGNILMGNEFDDPREMGPYKGIEHYYGIFDQSRDFTQLMSRYLAEKGIPSRVWSAVYPISGLKVEEVLVRRYPELFSLQRSCHSCRYEDGQLKPCGICTKCLGVMMFVEASGGNPKDILYAEADIRRLKDNVENARMRLDSDEINHLRRLLWQIDERGDTSHVEGIHRLPHETTAGEDIPDSMRSRILGILEQYTKGTYALNGDCWEIKSN